MTPIYDLEVPKGEKRRKFIIDIIENADSHPQSIHYGYKELSEGNNQNKRDSTFSYEDFVNYTIEELRDISARSGGSKSLGYYRDKDNVLRNREGIKVQ